MTLFFCFAVLFGDTVKMNNGEIFVGTIIRESEEKVWFKLERGGFLVFKKKEMQCIDGVNVNGEEEELEDKKRSDKDNSEQESEVPQQLKQDTGVKKTENGKKKKLSGLEDVGQGSEFYIHCPPGFREDKSAEAPPYLLIYKEKGTNAVVSVRADPVSGKFNKFVEEFLKKSGRELIEERVLKLDWLEKPGRLFVFKTDRKKSMILIVPYHSISWRIKCSVITDLFPGYRRLFMKTIKSFRITDNAETDREKLIRNP